MAEGFITDFDTNVKSRDRIGRGGELAMDGLPL
jgi:hypothetical protein